MLEKKFHLKYAITLKATYKTNKAKVIRDPNYYNTIIQIILCSIPSYYYKDSNIEYDSKKLPHAHYYIWTNVPLESYKLKGWHVYVKEIYDEEGWVSYIHKPDLSEYAFLME